MKFCEINYFSAEMYNHAYCQHSAANTYNIRVMFACVYETLYIWLYSNPLRSAVNNDSQQSFVKLADVLIETLD